jgi:putative tryptophan/tyrosine transport system substrate-binding protein
LLHEFVPDAMTAAVLLNPNFPRQAERKEIEDAARNFGWRLLIVGASNADEFDSTFAKLKTERVGALVIAGDTFFTSQSAKLGQLATRYGLPSAYLSREFVTAGGLMSYGSSVPDTIRQAGVYSGKILAGIPPADLPVMQPTKFELIINLKTAKALGLTIPETLLATADEVIQ